MSPEFVENALLIGVGLIAGWNFLAQPEWVSAIYDKIVEKIRAIGN